MSYKGLKLEPKVLLVHLKQLLAESKEQELSTECAMIDAMMATVRFAEHFDNGPRQRWSGSFGTLRHALRNLQHALDIEFKKE